MAQILPTAENYLASPVYEGICYLRAGDYNRQTRRVQAIPRFMGIDVAAIGAA
jgi:hypothetical protein